MRRYSIVGRRYGEHGEGVICACDSNPEPLAHIASMKRLFIGLVGKRKAFVDKYDGVRIIDHQAGRSWPINKT